MREPHPDVGAAHVRYAGRRRRDAGVWSYPASAEEGAAAVRGSSVDLVGKGVLTWAGAASSAVGLGLYIPVASLPPSLCILVSVFPDSQTCVLVVCAGHSDTR